MVLEAFLTLFAVLFLGTALYYLLLYGITAMATWLLVKWRGKAALERLDKQWGIVAVTDVIIAASYAVVVGVFYMAAGESVLRGDTELSFGMGIFYGWAVLLLFQHFMRPLVRLCDELLKRLAGRWQQRKAATMSHVPGAQEV